ncbi:MAG: class I SAM-dependent methyltransferase [Planctomycetota bacterium]
MSPSPLRRLLPHEPADPEPFWSARAGDPGRTSVMWRNEAYNEHAERDQLRVLEDWLPESRGAVLDLGCGTGRLSGLLARRFDRYVGVDLDTMVDVARERHPELKFTASRVQDYEPPADAFDLVVSMACISCACRAEEIPAVADGLVRSLRPGGRLLLVDAFHTLPILVRTSRISSRGVIDLLEERGPRLVHWSGIHCAPVRLLAARPGMSGRPGLTERLYRTGEAVLRLAPRLLGDYQVIVMDREGGGPSTSA